MIAVYASFLIDAEDEWRAHAQCSDSGGVIAAVTGQHRSGNSSHATIQTTEPDALRKLAAALIDAADQADALRAAELVAS